MGLGTSLGLRCVTFDFTDLIALSRMCVINMNSDGFTLATRLVSMPRSQNLGIHPSSKSLSRHSPFFYISASQDGVKSPSRLLASGKDSFLMISADLIELPPSPKFLNQMVKIFDPNKLNLSQTSSRTISKYYLSFPIVVPGFN